MTTDPHAPAPSRTVENDQFTDAHTDQLERQARLEARNADWLRQFHARFGGLVR